MKTIRFLFAFLVAANTLAIGQNVGIGTSSPTQKLDVAGRMRLRHTSGQTAGIWLDGPVNTSIGFIGTYDNNTIGLYGGVSGWQLVMDTDNGSVGIGTVSPTAKLDVNGDLRLRGNFPANGATLVSKDGNGNTYWQKAFAFRAEGLLDLADVNIPSQVWTKVLFSTLTSFNIGAPYQPINSIMVAPVKGIYFLNTQLEFYPSTDGKSGTVTMQVMRTRGGVSTVLAEHYFGTYISDVTSFRPEMTRNITGDYMLEAGDEIWIRVWTIGSHTCYGSATKASFNGHLVTQLF